MKENIFKKYSNEELCQMMEDLMTKAAFEEDSEIRKLAVEIYGKSDAITITGLAPHLGLELSRRLKNEKTPDVSWMWHCSCNGYGEQNIDYSFLFDDVENKEKLSPALNKAAQVGFRLALRRMEDIGAIKMCDIDRSPSEEDQKKWDEMMEKK